MTQMIAESPYLLLWLVRNKIRSQISEFRGRFADSFEATLHRIVGLAILAKFGLVHPVCVAPNRPHILDDIFQAARGPFRRQGHGLCRFPLESVPFGPALQ